MHLCPEKSFMVRVCTTTITNLLLFLSFTRRHLYKGNYVDKNNLGTILTQSKQPIKRPEALTSGLWTAAM